MHSKKLFLSSAVLFISVTLLFAGSVGASSEMWSQTYGGPKSETATSLVEASDGGFVLSGGSLLVKTDANGVMEWNQTYPVPTGSLIETADGGYGIAGGGSLAKLDLYGNLEWDQTYSGGSANSLIETSDGGYALAGTLDSLDSNGTTDFWLVKTDSKGVMEWNQTYGGAEVERAYSLVETSDEGFALAGERIVSEGDGYRAWRFWLVRTDEDGNMFSVNKNNGKINWKYNTKFKIKAIPSFDKSSVYIGNLNGDLYSFNIHEGNLNWILKTEGLINTTPIIFKNMLVQPNLKKQVDLVDKLNGKIIESISFVGRCRTTPFYFTGKLFFGIDKDDVYCFKVNEI